MNLTPEHLAILHKIDGSSGIGVRVPPSSARDQLRKAKFIYSRPPNAGIGRAISGHGHRWYLTADGHALVLAEGGN